MVGANDASPQNKDVIELIDFEWHMEPELDHQERAGSWGHKRLVPTIRMTCDQARETILLTQCRHPTSSDPLSRPPKFIPNAGADFCAAYGPATGGPVF